jgi:hypothetical protein
MSARSRRSSRGASRSDEEAYTQTQTQGGLAVGLVVAGVSLITALGARLLWGRRKPEPAPARRPRKALPPRRARSTASAASSARTR